jgi:hypothetical protein
VSVLRSSNAQPLLECVVKIANGKRCHFYFFP